MEELGKINSNSLNHLIIQLIIKYIESNSVQLLIVYLVVRAIKLPYTFFIQWSMLPLANIFKRFKLWYLDVSVIQIDHCILSVPYC